MSEPVAKHTAEELLRQAQAWADGKLRAGWTRSDAAEALKAMLYGASDEELSKLEEEIDARHHRSNADAGAGAGAGTAGER